MIESLWQDIRYGLRSLRQHPLFTFVAVLTLGLGIGANTAIFSVVDAIMLRPLGYEHAEQLVEVVLTDDRTAEKTPQLSFPNYRDLRTQSRTFAQLSAFRYWLFNLSGADHPQSLLGVYVGDSLFTALRTRPALGRLFGPGVENTAYPHEAVLSYGLWQRRFGSDRSVIGTDVVIDGRPVTVVGVLPRDFRFPDLVPSSAPLPARAPDLFMPLANNPVAGLDERSNDNYWVLGRLAPGATQATAAADLNRVAAGLAKDYPNNNTHIGMVPVPLHEQITGTAGRPLAVLFGAVALVLLIACANVGGLLLARAVQRHREISIRTALGASPRRLARQLLTESVLLGLMGGLLGVVLASWGVELLKTVAPNTIPRLDEVAVNARVLVFGLVASMGTGVLFGLVPVFQQRSNGPAAALRESGRSSGSTASRRLRGGLVVAEVALAVVLLTGAGLLLRSFASLAAVNAGFDGRNVMTMFTLLPPTRYTSDTALVQYEQRVLAALNELPGVTSAAMVNTLPLSNLGNTTSIDIVGKPAGASNEMPEVDYRIMDGPYFRTLGMPIVSGRDFNTADARGAPLVVIVNQAAARKFFPGVDAVGRQIKVMSGDSRPRTIVGIVGDVHGEALELSAKPEVSAPFAQSPDFMVSLAIRGKGDPRSLLPAIRRALAGADPDVAYYAERTMDDLRSASLANRRFNLQLLGGFALLALVLAAVGLYGVIAFSVSQRTREIGIRAALGAERGRITSLVLNEGAKLGLLGLGIGLVASIAVTRVLSGLLYQVSATDPLTFVGVLLFLGGTVLLASYLPARRASRIDPVDALRNE